MASPKVQTRQLSKAATVVALVLVLALQAVAVFGQGGGKITDPVEKSALLAFRRALRDRRNYLLTWNNATDPCTAGWNGVFCQPDLQPPGNQIYLHVTELRLFTFGLTGQLVPELGNLSALYTLDVMWNYLTGPIPKEIGRIAPLKILNLNGNHLNGEIPSELGNLTSMNRLQLDENNLTGPIPRSFKNLLSVAHVHLNNNSLSGPIPDVLGELPNMIHLLVDNNLLTGPMPETLRNVSTLTILQFDNNQIRGTFPDYTSLSRLTKLSCRNCGLSGNMPNFTGLEHLNFIDLSHNNLAGPLPVLTMTNLTTLDVSHNQLTGQIPSTFASAPALQTLRVGNNLLNGTIPGFETDFATNPQQLDFQNNSFSFVSLDLIAASTRERNLDLRLAGNPDLCNSQAYIEELSTSCAPKLGDEFQPPYPGGHLPKGGPILVTYRLKSPGFTYFTANYRLEFSEYVAKAVSVEPDRVQIQSYEWKVGPRLQMVVLINPPRSQKFNRSQVADIERKFANWNVSNSTLFGPYELLAFVWPGKAPSKLSKGAIAGIVVAFLLAVLLVLGLLLLCLVQRRRKAALAARKKKLQLQSAKQLKIAGVTAFTFEEMMQATDNFSVEKEVGKGGYGKVYRGVLENGQAVAIKRASDEARQRNSEFYNEIELLSRCHHRNLVSLVGYCNDEGEQMLVYEFMENGTLDDNLHNEKENKLDFGARLSLALGAARGILYLHTEASPPIFHRDIKSNNILLDEKGQAKVADFGLSKLAPDIVDDLEAEQHVSTVVKGTPGYLDPEYFLTRKLTDKSDVYSFGIVLLELATALPPIAHGKNIVREIKPYYDNGNWSEVIDKRLDKYSEETMENFVRLALSCVNNDPSSRPTMHELTRTLEGLVLTTQGKELRNVLSLDLAKDPYMEQLKKYQDLSGISGSSLGISGTSVPEFDTGSSQTSKYQPQSSKFSVNERDISPR